MTPWGQDSRSEAWFWEVSGKRQRSRLPPEYSPTQPSLRQAQEPWGWGTPKASYKKTMEPNTMVTLATVSQKATQRKRVVLAREQPKVVRSL